MSVRLPILSIDRVVESQLCAGCGACASVAPGVFQMIDQVDAGRRPRRLVPVGSRVADEDAAAMICPGSRLEHPADSEGLERTLRKYWGPVRRVWEGHAVDAVIRHRGSSGGAATALAAHSLERRGFAGVLHAAADPDVPYLNRTVLSRTRAELIDRAGSRYAPASPCDGLGMIEAAGAHCVFIGKPCDVAGARRVSQVRQALHDRLGLLIAFFCAGAPSTQGTLDLLKRVGVEDPRRVRSLRYRGHGWPGRWTVAWTDEGGGAREASLSYEESWGFLQRYRPWRCAICPDHTGEFADVSVGDPWYRPPTEGEPGRSLILARTKRGEDAVLNAAADGYLVLTREDPTLLPRSQPNILKTRGRLWGQLTTLQLLGAPVPQYRGFPTFGAWLGGLGVRAKLQSTIGTVRRARQRGIAGRAGRPRIDTQP